MSTQVERSERNADPLSARGREAEDGAGRSRGHVVSLRACPSVTHALETLVESALPSEESRKERLSLSHTSLHHASAPNS